MHDSSQCNGEVSPHRRFITPLFGVSLFIAFWVAAVLVCLPGIDSPLMYDSTFLSDHAHSFMGGDLRNIIGIFPQRPLVMLSFYVNYLFTGLAPHFLRMFNALLVACSGVCLTLLSLMLIESRHGSSPGTRAERVAVSVFVGLVFVVHPLQSLVILFVWQRAAILACACYLAALALYVAWRSGRIGGNAVAVVSIGGLIAAGLLSKEHVISLPLVFLLAEVIVFRQDFRQLVNRALVIGLITVPGLLVYLGVTHALHKPGSLEIPGVLTRLQNNYAMSGVTPLQVALTEARVCFSYLAMIVAPFLYGVELIRAETVSRSLLDPPVTFAACGGVIAVLAMAVTLVRKQPVISFGIFLFIVSIVPEMFLVPQYLFFGYRAILPMAGVLIVAAQLALMLLKQIRGTLAESAFIPAAVSAGLLIVALFAVSGHLQAETWKPRAFWAENYERLPSRPSGVQELPYLHILVNYGTQQLNSGDLQGAVKTFLRARNINPDYHLIHANLGNALLRLGKPDEALAHYQRAIELRPASSKVLIQMGNAQVKLGRNRDAAEHFRKALEVNPHAAEAHRLMGDMLAREGKLPVAEQHYREAVRIDPSMVRALNTLGNILLARGKPLEAAKHYEKAIDADPRSAEPYNNLGAALMQLNRVDAAARNFQRAVELRPGFAKAHANLGFALLDMGKKSAGIKQLQRALDLRPDLQDARKTLQGVLQERGNRTER